MAPAWRWPRLALVLGALAVMALLSVAGWRLSGGQLYTMTTGSMAPITPVGSLVIDRPAGHDLHVGETITFHASPTPGSPLFTHRIVAVMAGPTYRVEGWAERHPDPWIIHPDEIVGRTVAQVWGIGWLYRALPFEVVGIALFFLVYPLVARRSQAAFSTLWFTALGVVPLFIWRPLVGAESIATRAEGTRRLAVRVENIGLLPGRDAVRHADHSVRLASGGIKWLVGPTPRGVLIVAQSVMLPWWGWAILVVAVSSPLIAHVLHTRQPPRPLGPSS